MSLTASGPEAQDALFEKPPKAHVPAALANASMRLDFPPSYVLVGVYRLFTDKLLYRPAWDKCRHAARRGAIVGAIWVGCSICLHTLETNSNVITGCLDIFNPEEVY